MIWAIHLVFAIRLVFYFMDYLLKKKTYLELIIPILSVRLYICPSGVSQI